VGDDGSGRRPVGIYAEAFASGSEHREQYHCEGVDEEQAVAPGWFADARDAGPQAERRSLMSRKLGSIVHRLA
jgi:hypothetical protein